MSVISEFKHETLQDTDSITEYLKVITEGFESGEIVFKNDKEQILLHPDGMIELEIKAKKKDKKVKLSLKLKWKEKTSAEEDQNRLIIDTKI